MRPLITLFLLTILLSSTNTTIAQSYEKSLLWRITGNGLKQPSYLYGTMHLRVRKLFAFPDSLYTAINNTEVFALEVNPDSINAGLSEYYDRVMNKYESNEASEENNNDKKLTEILTKAELKALKQSMGNSKEIDPDKLTLKQTYMLKNKIMQPKPRKDDMPVFMDVFLSQIAKDKGKSFAGLEHFSDQIQLLDSVDFSHVDSKKLIEVFSENGSVIDRMIEMYVNRDLNSLQRVAEIFPEKEENALISKRNKKMLRSMDSIMKKHSLFAAVGTLHLTGKLGLISLLKQAGYNVEPVMCETTTDGAVYQFRNPVNEWKEYTFSTEGYSVSMPNDPIDVNAEGLIMKTSVDIGASTSYISCYYNLSAITDEQRKGFLETIAKGLQSKADGDVSKKTINGEFEGAEYKLKGTDKLYYVVRLLTKDKGFYMLIVTAQSPDVIYADKFFNSLKVVTKADRLYGSKTFEDIGVTAMVPSEKFRKKIQYSADSSTKQIMYSYSDASNNLQYYIVCNVNMPGSLQNSDSDFLKLFINNDSTEIPKYYAVVDTGANYRGYLLTTDSFSGYRIHSKIAFAGNKIYNIIIQYPDNEKGKEQSEEFISSIKIKPLLHSPIENYKVSNMRVKLPAGPEKSVKANFKLNVVNDSLFTYRSIDTVSATYYELNENKIGEDEWIISDTAYLMALLKKNLKNDEFNPIYSIIKKGNSCYAEVCSQRSSTNMEHRLKIILNGRKLYSIETFLSNSIHDKSLVDSVFASFSFINNNNELVASNPKNFLSRLYSKDTTINAQSRLRLYQLSFSKQDVPYILDAIRENYIKKASLDTHGVYATIFLNRLNQVNNMLSIKQIEDLYNEPTFEKNRIDLLTLLLSQDDTVAGIDKFKELALTKRPTNGYSYALLSKLEKYSKYSKKLFPEMFDLCTDTILSYMVNDLAMYLLDSGIVDKKDFQKYLPNILKYSAASREGKPEDINTSIVSLLSYFDEPDAISEIKKYQYVNNASVKYTAVSKLLESDIKPLQTAIDSLAVDSFYLLDIYSLLKEKNMHNMIPAKYLTQQHFSACIFKNWDEDGVYELGKLLGVKTKTYNGSKANFYLYRVKEIEGDGTVFLAVIGPFSLDKKILTVDEYSAIGISEEQVDEKKLDQQLQLYLIKRKIDSSRTFQSY